MPTQPTPLFTLRGRRAKPLRGHQREVIIASEPAWSEGHAGFMLAVVEESGELNYFYATSLKLIEEIGESKAQREDKHHGFHF